MSHRSLRVAISAHLLAPHGAGYRNAGIHTYIDQTVRRLPEVDPELRLTLFARHVPEGLSAAIEPRATRWPTGRPALRILWEQLRLPLAARRFDVVHASAFVAPQICWRPTVVTIYDLSFALFPQYFRGLNQAYLRIGTRRSARRARRVLAISEHTRRDIHRLYDVPLDRIDVAYPGVDAALTPAAPESVVEFKRRKQLPDRFLLFLGTLEPRKNLVMMIQAFAQLKRERPEAMLVLAGGVGWLADDVFAEIDRSGVRDSVILPGFVPAEEKALWYAAATAFVYPSIYEGFGLPPLEAMACGTPVIVSNAASLPEVVGEAGLNVAPDDVSGWSHAMRRLWSDAALRADLSERGLAQARRFSWTETARITAAAYRAAAR
jgi:glycosyltransferase involved in cell wall biosynthesis